jgi:predicted nucleotidyltransferase
MLEAMTDELPIPARVRAMASHLGEIPGVVGVVLGGSRASGAHRPDSDVDLGLYYRGRLDIAALRALAAHSADEVLDVADVGGWGPWVNGGAWLVVDGVRVDWIYRDLDRVRVAWADARAGRYELGIQAGHPLGFYSHMYAAEMALCRVLFDPTGELGQLRAETQQYPEPLGRALVTAIWETELLLGGMAKYAVSTADAWYAAGGLFRVIGVLAHALHGHHGRWVTHEKRLVAAASLLPAAPRDFAGRVQGILSRLGASGEELGAAIAGVRALVTDTLARLPPRAG